MSKRAFDIIASLAGLLILSPVLLICMFLIWKQDKHTPFYLGKRVGKGGRPFNMVKLRSMIIDADKSGVDSTTTSDNRITAVGHFIRRYKIDELSQLWNVLIGDMSLVGPRPNVQWAVDSYSEVECRLISARPGITDLSSIVFSDENAILEGSLNPDLAYDQLIRPWKSRLGLIYVDNQSVLLDIKIIIVTLVAIVKKSKALDMLYNILVSLNADSDLLEVAKRNQALKPTPPPGFDAVIMANKMK